MQEPTTNMLIVCLITVNRTLFSKIIKHVRRDHYYQCVLNSITTGHLALDRHGLDSHICTKAH